MKHTYFLLIFLSIITFSCNKSSDSIEPETPCLPYALPDYRIKEILTVENGVNTRSEYFYDELGRIIHQKDSGTYLREVFWEYTGGKVLLLSGDSTVFETLILNSSGYAESNWVTLPSSYYHWEYDSSGFMVEQSSSAPQAGTTTYQYIYHCRNIVSVVKFWSWFGSPPTTDPEVIYALDYYGDQRNTIGNENTGIGYFGKQNNCLVKWNIAYQGKEIDTVGVYTYEFDSLNRVATETIKKAGAVIRIRQFIYENDRSGR